MKLPSLFTILLTPALLVAAPGDTPQWRGPNRDGIFPSTGLLKQWPTEGPTLAWKAEKLGQGLASVSIADGKIFTTGGRDGAQHIIALDLATQRELWTAKLSSHGGEPRCTPTVDSGLVFAVSTEGDLVCVRASDGQLVWQKSYATDFGTHGKPTWEFSESPLVDGDLLIIAPGSDQALMAALDKKTGAILWKTSTRLSGKGHESAGYTGAVVSNAGGIRQYITLHGKGAIGVDAKTGRLLWHYNRVANGTAVIPTPLVWDDYVFVSSGYGTGAALLKIVPDDAPVPAPPAPQVDEAKVSEQTSKLAGLKAAMASRREARSKFTKGTSEYETADKLVQALKPDLDKVQEDLDKLRGVKPGGGVRIPGSPVAVQELYWLNAGRFQNHHGGMVRLGQYIYAGKGHNNGFPICLDWKTGRAVWEKERGPGKESAAVIAADGHLYFRYQDGVMALIEATPSGYVEKGAFKLAVVNGPSWPHPVIHDGRLYLRDQGVLMCYDLRAN